MGAPKKKWSLEEEAALKAGIDRYGAGKWSAILNDPDYQSVLSARTNVDLKDKWRNINVMLNGVGYRQRGMGVPKVKSAPKSQNKNVAASSGAMVKYVAPKPAKIPKLQNKDPAPAMAAATATAAATSGLALVVKPPEDLNNDMQIDPPSLDMEIVQVDSPKAATAVVKYEIDVEMQHKMMEEAVDVGKHGIAKAKHEVDFILKKLVDMTAEEVAIAAGEAVAEAEVAIERAERAMREAEAAEREAEAARVFSEAAQIACKRFW